MKKWKMAAAWCCLLTKRLYRKPAFLAILLLIPLLVLGYGMAARQDSGVITVALAREDGDPLAVSVTEKLAQSNGLILFRLCTSPEEAETLVRTGKTDAAWIFSAEMEAKVCRFVNDPARRNAFVTVVERESTVPLMLAREKLSGAVFSCCSEKMYLSWLRTNVPELADASDETLLACYNRVSMDTELFSYACLDGTAAGVPETNYLLTPVRGLLAVVLVLFGLATAMYGIRDEKQGTFALVPEGKRGLVEFACQMISGIHGAAAVLLALIAAGLTVSPAREAGVLLLYTVCVAVFSMTVRSLFGTLRSLGTLLPLLIAVMLAICPVFLDLGKLRAVQYLFPPTYYINGASNNRDLLRMMAYTGVLFAIRFSVGKLRKGR